MNEEEMKKIGEWWKNWVIDKIYHLGHRIIELEKAVDKMERRLGKEGKKYEEE